MANIRDFLESDRQACAEVFASLTPWFGIPEAVDNYLAGLGEVPTWVAEIDGNLVGFLATKPHTDDAAEVWVAAVASDRHNQGIGRALVAQAESFCQETGRSFLQVKTLDSSHESPEYAATRKAWLAMGFRPLQTFPDLWDPANPALQLVKLVKGPSGSERVSAHDQIEALGLQPHPEGGYFRETWRSNRVLDLPDYDGPRNAGTCIHFLLPTGEESAWHKVASDEIWLWQGGDPLDLLIAAQKAGEVESIRLGVDRFQAVVPGGKWQAARPVAGQHGYALVGCVVVPGFDFADFEM